ncbi:MAG TPA: redoxin domain-containing protein [Acidimicrobiales bacterium]|nr:redoxin domain-containing protein [Acidimicrobiales bacterium]
MNRSRRSLLSLGIGCALAAVLALVLFVGIGTGSTHAPGNGQDDSIVNTAPGINQAAANLLELNVVPPAKSLTAPGFTLVDQHGRTVSLDQYRGKVVIWSINDDRCTDMCALLAQSIVAADADLGAAARDVVFLSVNANPYYPAPKDVLQWSQTNDVESLPNWVYVTGTPPQLERTWDAYKVNVVLDAENRTVVHDTALDFIDPAGRIRSYGYFSEGSLSTAFYAHTMAQMADDLLPAAERVTVGGPSVNAPATDGATIGDRAPAFTLSPLAHATTGSSAQLETKPTLLNFWSSTCQICTSEMPALQQVEKDYGTQVNVVGIDVADPRSTAASFATHLGVGYPLLADPDGATAAGYRVTALPVTFVVAPGGQILSRHDGALTAPELEAVLQMQFPQLAS